MAHELNDQWRVLSPALVNRTIWIECVVAFRTCRANAELRNDTAHSIARHHSPALNCGDGAKLAGSGSTAAQRQ